MQSQPPSFATMDTSESNLENSSAKGKKVAFMSSIVSDTVVATQATVKRK